MEAIEGKVNEKMSRIINIINFDSFYAGFCTFYDKHYLLGFSFMQSCPPCILGNHFICGGNIAEVKQISKKELRGLIISKVKYKLIESYKSKNYRTSICVDSLSYNLKEMLQFFQGKEKNEENRIIVCFL